MTLIAHKAYTENKYQGYQRLYYPHLKNGSENQRKCVFLSSRSILSGFQYSNRLLTVNRYDVFIQYQKVRKYLKRHSENYFFR